MSFAPVVDLSQHFSHESILALAGVTVKGGIPDITRCPFCSNESLFIVNDPARGGNHWLYCSSCRFSGDIIELYCRIRNLDLKEGIYKAVAEGMTKGVVLDLSSAKITSYVDEFAGYRAKVNGIWKTMQENTTADLTPEVIDRIQSEHLWSGWRGNGRECFSRFIGSGKAKEIRKLFKGCYDFIPKGAHQLLIANYQDVPGRVCCFQFLAEDGERSLKMVPHDGGQNILEGGLAMLDVLRPVEGTVYAVDDILVAWHMHKLRFMNSNIPLKLVAFNESTSSAWQYVNAAKVVMWTNKLTWRVFDQAKRARNVHIAFRPNPRQREFHAYFADMTVEGAMAVMEKSAVPWELALAEWVTGMEREDLAREAIQLLALSQYEYNHVLEVCPPHLRKKFSILHDDTRSSKSIIFNRRTYVEQDDGWWELHPRIGKDLISNAVIRVHREICDTTEGKFYWSGVVAYEGKNTPFNDLLDNIEKDPVKWIRTVLAKAGLGSPVICKSQSTLITGLARAFSKPKASTMNSRVGVQLDGSFIMPRFTMVDGKVRPTGEPPVAIMPAKNVIPPERRPDFKFTPCESQGVWLALAACYVAQQISVMRGFVSRAVAVVGKPGTSAEHAIHHMANTAGMLTIKLTTIARRDDLSRGMNFDYPTFYETGFVLGCLGRFPTTPMRPCFMEATGAEAASLCSSGYVVTVKGMGKPDGELPLMDTILDYIANLQRNDYRIEGEGSPERMILNDMCKVLEVPVELQKLANDALVDLRKGEWFVKMVQLIFRLYGINSLHVAFAANIRNGHITQEYEREAKYIYIDDDEKKVLMPRWGFLRIIKRNLYPSPDIEGCIEDLTGSEILMPVKEKLDGWIVNLDDWNRIGLIDIGS